MRCVGGGAAERGGALGNSSVRACEEVLLSMALDYEGFAEIPIYSSPGEFRHAMAYVHMAVGSSPPAAGEAWWRQAADVEVFGFVLGWLVRAQCLWSLYR